MRVHHHAKAASKAMGVAERKWIKATAWSLPGWTLRILDTAHHAKKGLGSVYASQPGHFEKV